MDQLAVAVSPETVAKAKAAADARGESLDSFVEHALSEAIDEHLAFEETMAEADRDFETGNTHSLEEVLEWLKDSRARAEAEIARRNKAA